MSPGIINPRNERFRLIAFQNIQKISNPPSINIFLVRRKLMRFWKNRMNSIKIEAKSEPEPWFCVHIQILLWILEPLKKAGLIFVYFFSPSKMHSCYKIFVLVPLNNISNIVKSWFCITLIQNIILEPFLSGSHLKSGPKSYQNPVLHGACMVLGPDLRRLSLKNSSEIIFWIKVIQNHDFGALEMLCSGTVSNLMLRKWIWIG